MAFRGFMNDTDHALAVPVLANRRADAHQQSRVGIARCLVVDRLRQPEGKQRRRLDLEREIGQHVLHQRLVDQIARWKARRDVV